MGPINHLFNILLLAPEEIRAYRLQKLLGISPKDALTIIRRKDARTRSAIEGAWGTTIYTSGIQIFYDLILEETCLDSKNALSYEDTARIILSALDVYKGYMTEKSADEVDQHVQTLHMLQSHFSADTHIITISPLLLSFHGPYTRDRWKNRLQETVELKKSVDGLIAAD